MIAILAALPSDPQTSLSEALRILSSLQIAQQLRDVKDQLVVQSQWQETAALRAEEAEKSDSIAREYLQAEQERNEELELDLAEQQNVNRNMALEIESLLEQQRAIECAARGMQESLRIVRNNLPPPTPQAAVLSLLSDDETDGTIRVATGTPPNRKRRGSEIQNRSNKAKMKCRRL